MPGLTTIASVASIAGLIFSILAWRAAGDASSAAREARRVARQSSAARDSERLSQNGKELLTLLDHDKYEAAVTRSRDVESAIGELRSRWARFLPPGASADLVTARGQILILSKTISAQGPPTDAAGKERLLEIVHGVLATLDDIAGKLASEIEEREESHNA